MNHARPGIITTALAIVATSASLWATAGYAEHEDYPRDVPATLPGYCELTLRTHDDGTQFAFCPDAIYVYDADGQPYENANHVPVRDPGWYPCNDWYCVAVYLHEKGA